ncbi:MAG: transglutaminase domain-containing protein [Deltaproteobacteria bacterium]|nr:transglutaminase domain-containing protein [Deltaproteobacteria bacterium]
MTKFKFRSVWGIGMIIVFLVLLAIRLQLFEEKSIDRPMAPRTALTHASESWMNIYQNKKKIGVIRRTFTPLSSGHFQTSENITMQINTMGVIQALSIATDSNLNPDMTFSSFNFELNSSLFRFQARGYVSDKKLILYTGLPSSPQKTIIPVAEIPHISGNIYEAAFRGGLEKSATRDFSIFDPSTLSIRKVSVTRSADEIIPIMGKRVLTQKLCADFMGAKNCAWLAGDGEILRESGMLGLSMEKVNAEQARVGISPDGAADMTQVASIPSNLLIAEPAKLTAITIKITGIRTQGLLLQGGRQNFNQNSLTITRETIPTASGQAAIPPVFQTYLQPSPLIQSADMKMTAQVQKIIHPADSPPVRLRKIVGWVYRTLEKKPVLSVPNALEVLKNKMGDCNEHAVLTAALLRAAGIPAQIEMGLIYLNGRFYYHAWNLAYIGQWVTVDTVFNQIPADVTHLRLVRGEGAEQLDLLGLMGRIKLEVTSIRND